MKLIYSTQAMIEMDAIAAFIQQNSPRSALRFLEAVENTCKRLLTFPEFGAIFETSEPNAAGLRVCLVTGFEKYLVFYRVRSAEIHIERVVNGTRDLPSILKEGT
jgi:plasmid stabilization system protein ParE